MSTTNVSASIPSLAFQADPFFGSVERILQRDYVGSWADASLEYSRIRSGLIWTDLRALTAAACTKANQDKAKQLLKELQSVSADLGDTAPSSATSFAAAESVVKLWMPPVKVTVPASSGAKPAAKKVVNTFAALAEDSEEE